MAAGWNWEWVVQEDGDTNIASDFLPADPRIVFGTGLRARAAVARTMALSLASGDRIRALDADDYLLPGALARDIEALDRNAWCTSAAVDLVPGGHRVPGPYDPENGPVSPGRFHAEQLEEQLSVQAVTFAAHTELVWALGGWPALTGAETVGLLLAAEAVSTGEFIAEPSLVYRKHDAQTTASPRYWDENETHARINAALKRADTLRRTGWRWKP
jgi:glycosyltransferase involved in cell wall biosynthesis